MPKQALTDGEIKDIEKFLIEKFLEAQKNASEDTAVKAKIDELIKKLDEMEIGS